MLNSKRQLSITLTEPVVFLRSSDPSGRHSPDPGDPPACVRGVLNLNVVKPIGISSIEVELAGVLVLRPPDEVGLPSRRIDLPERYKICYSTMTVFRADQDSRGRRPSSVGPRLSEVGSDYNNEYAAATFSRPLSLPRGRSDGQRSITGVPPNIDPTPLYTPVAQSLTPFQPRLGSPVENTTQTLEEPSQILRENSDGRAHPDGFAAVVSPSSHLHSSASSISTPTTHSDAPSTPNNSLHRENSDLTDDMAHTSPTFEGNTLIHDTAEGPSHVPPYHRHSPIHFSLAHPPECTQPRTRANRRDSSNASSGRSRLRLSLSSVLDAVMEVTSRGPSKSRGLSESEERERGRTRVRKAAEEYGRARSEVGEGTGAGNGIQVRANAFHSHGHMEHRDHHLHDLARILGLEREQEKGTDEEKKGKEHGEGWREFKPGTYSYPISFLLPPNITPSFSVPHASLGYVIKAVAHRPGTFTSKLSCQVPLVVVASPAIGTVEVGGDPGPLIVQREWEGKLAYSFGLSSRWFLLGSQHHPEAAVSEGVRANAGSLTEAEIEVRAGAAYGTATLDITLMPLEKVKIWKLCVIVDQRIGYVDGRGELFGDDTRQVKLLEIEDTCLSEEIMDEEEQTHKYKHKYKHDFVRIPLLPTPLSPHRSPLLRHIPPSVDPSVLAGPGPYTLSTVIGLPGCSGSECGLHFTIKHRNSTVKVQHSLRLIARVEGVGDEVAAGHEEGDKRRWFDIAVKTPITILSCRSTPEYHSLPKYSQVSEDSPQDLAACACQSNVAGPTEREQRHRHRHEAGPHPERVLTSGSWSSVESDDLAGHVHHHADRGHSRSPLRSPRNGHTTSLMASPHPHPHPLPPATAHARETSWRRSSAHVQPRPHRDAHDQYHRHSGTQSYTVFTSRVHAHSQTPPISSPYVSRPPSPLAQYERLVSGLESEAGDAPPSYESVTAGF